MPSMNRRRPRNSTHVCLTACCIPMKQFSATLATLPLRTTQNRVKWRKLFCINRASDFMSCTSGVVMLSREKKSRRRMLVSSLMLCSCLCRPTGMNSFGAALEFSDLPCQTNRRHVRVSLMFSATHISLRSMLWCNGAWTLPSRRVTTHRARVGGSERGAVAHIMLQCACGTRTSLATPGHLHQAGVLIDPSYLLTFTTPSPHTHCNTFSTTH